MQFRSPTLPDCLTPTVAAELKEVTVHRKFTLGHIEDMANIAASHVGRMWDMFAQQIGIIPGGQVR